MKISNLVLLTSIAVMGFMNTQAQTADDIINKWIDAMGGKDKLAGIKTVRMEGDMNIMNNNAPYKASLINGKGFKSETDFNGQKVIDCYTVDSGWSVNPLAGITSPVNMPPAQVKMGQLQLDATGPLYNYAAKGSKVELQGKENVNGPTSYKIKLTTSSGIEASYFIDSASSYMVKEVTTTNADGQNFEIVTLTSDFKKTGEGFLMPFSMELSLPGLTLTITFKTIEVNKDIDPAIFDKPKT